MRKPSNLYDVWTDGSYNNARHVGGAGWVIKHGDDAPQEGRKGIKDIPSDAMPHGSDLAEIFAVKSALSTIPVGSTVKLRMDCQNVIDWFEAGKITSKSKSDVRLLRTAFSGALKEVGVMEKVEFIKVGGNSNPYLARAHELSREGRHLVMPPKKPKRNAGKPQRKRGFSHSR